MSQRPNRYSACDRWIISFDHALATLHGRPATTHRKTPGAELEASVLTESQRRRSVGLMRVNHAGEVSAQALYQGQALTAKLPAVRAAMEQAALEENDHLVWCAERIHDLGGRTSVLNPVWYFGSFLIGALAGKIGDQWSLGFVAETEKQVIAHLEAHLNQLAATDHKSRAILEQMQRDEAHHGELAKSAGGVDLPLPIQKLMGMMSKVMTRSSYWV